MGTKEQSLHLLFLEDWPEEIERVHQLLKEILGEKVNLDYACTEKEYLHLIETQSYDLLLVDHKPPTFDVINVLQQTRRLCLQTPIICISGMIGEDNAVELIKQGVMDYVQKDRLNRLCLAVPRALASVAAEAERTRTEYELRNAKEQLEEVQRIANIGSWEWNLETNKVVYSNEVYVIYGLDPNTDLYKGITFNYVHAEDCERVLNAQKAAINGSSPCYEVEYPLKRKKDGKVIYIASKGIVKRDNSGKAVSMLGFMQDITERKQIELALQKAKVSLQEAQSIACIGSWDWDISSKTLWWSDESFRLLGMDPSSEPVLDLHYERIDKADRDRVANARDLALKKRVPMDVTYRMVSLDGSTKYIRSLGQAKYNDFGQPIYMSGTMQDVTQQMLAEKHLRKVQQNMEDAQRIARVGSWEFDPRTGEVFWSAECYRIVGLDPKITHASRGLTYEYMDEVDKRCLYRAMEAAINEHKSFSLEYALHRSDGSTTYVNTRGSAQLDTEGKTLFLTGTMQDITDRMLNQKKALEEEKRRIDAETRMCVLTEFFSNISHELKTPLSLILMQIDSMRMNLSNKSRMMKLLDDSSLNAYRLVRLVNNLLDIVKIDSGFMKLNLRKRDIVNAVKSICNSVSTYAASKSITVECVCFTKIKEMDLDLDKLDRILLNLLSNAIKHTPENGKIAVTIKELEDKVRIGVRDTGIGIPGDMLQSIFDRFVQVNNRMSRQAEGCGIGLSLVKSLVEIHGGKIWVESEVGKGSEFVVELPATVSGVANKQEVIESFALNKKVMMELSDLSI